MQEKSSDGTDTIPPYIFEYNTDFALPNYVTNQLDHFGYWNSNTQNTLIPIIKLQTSSTALNQNGANR